MKLRIARATNNLERISKMYMEGLGMKQLSSFEDHAGFSGVMVGHQAVDYHFEFTKEDGAIAPPSHSHEQLIVFYLGSNEKAEAMKRSMIAAGFQLVKSHNPYWDENGFTLEDFEGYRIVLCRNS